VLSTEQIELLKAGIDWNLAHPSPRAKVASQPDDPGWFIEDFCNWQENRLYRQFLASVPLGAIGALLTGSAEIRLYHDHMLTKEPGTRQRTPWHQISPITTLKDSRMSAAGYRWIRSAAVRPLSSWPALIAARG